MPQATNITTKDETGASVTLTLMSPAAGDGSVASWMEKGGVAPIVNNRLTISASKTSVGSRKVQVKFTVPASYVDPVTGLPKVTSAFEFNGSVSVPDLFPESKRDGAVARLAWIFQDSGVRASLRDALSST